MNIWGNTKDQDETTLFTAPKKLGEGRTLMRGDWGIKQWMPFLIGAYWYLPLNTCLLQQLTDGSIVQICCWKATP
jgi:hypothetical protein